MNRIRRDAPSNRNSDTEHCSLGGMGSEPMRTRYTALPKSTHHVHCMPTVRAHCVVVGDAQCSATGSWSGYTTARSTCSRVSRVS